MIHFLQKSIQTVFLGASNSITQLSRTRRLGYCLITQGYLSQNQQRDNCDKGQGFFLHAFRKMRSKYNDKYDDIYIQLSISYS